MAEPAVGRLRVLLMCMPWQGLHIPSLALSTLAPLGRSHPLVGRLDVRYASIEWAEHIRTLTAGRVGSAKYREISESDLSAVGEWIFSGALHHDDAPELTQYFAGVSGSGVDLATAAELYRLAGPFVAELADDVCRAEYDVIGFTSTFVQNVSSLALARAVKARSPKTTVIFGGANCDDQQGAALHRNFPFVDYVVRGEAEIAFAQLLGLIGGDPAVLSRDIQGLCWWDGNTSVANPMPVAGVSVDHIPEPTFDEYFAAFAAAPVCRSTRPRIVMEGARGCWWGQKHHCTFCGLNDLTINFRAKEPDRVFSELCRAVEKHQVLDVVFADNIIDQRYLRELLPRVGELGWDLRVFFETKSNQTYAQLEQMANAGLTQVQPGIESFSTAVLRLMRKGVTGWQNVRFLRDCRTLAIDPLWNLLYGFPGEADEDYAPMVEQLPHLFHLRPPQGTSRVALTRFSPYFTDPSLGMANLGPARIFEQIYRLPRVELDDLVYLFQSPETGVSKGLVTQMEQYVHAWLARGAACSLVAFDGDGSSDLVLVDERQASRTVQYILSGSASVVYRALLKGRSTGALTAMMAANPLAPPAGQILDLLDGWHADGLVFRDGDIHVALATGLGYQ